MGGSAEEGVDVVEDFGLLLGRGGVGHVVVGGGGEVDDGDGQAGEFGGAGEEEQEQAGRGHLLSIAGVRAARGEPARPEVS